MARVYQRTILRYRKRRAMGPTITITVTPARDSDGRKAHAAPGQLFDGLGERLVISRSTQPFLDACRLLLSEGANPSTPVAMRHQPQAFPEFLEIPVRARAQARTTTPCASTIGAAAGLTVEEGERRPTFRRWKPGRRGRQPAHASNRKGRDLAQDRLAAEYPPGQPSPERRTRSVNFFLGGGPKGGPEFAARRDHRSSGRGCAPAGLWVPSWHQSNRRRGALEEIARSLLMHPCPPWWALKNCWPWPRKASRPMARASSSIATVFCPAHCSYERQPDNAPRPQICIGADGACAYGRLDRPCPATDGLFQLGARRGSAGIRRGVQQHYCVALRHFLAATSIVARQVNSTRL
jgi:hypothetical protein